MNSVLWLYDDTDLFRSEVQHKLKSMSDLEFIDFVLSNNLIEEYYNKDRLFEACYLYALLKHLFRINKITNFKTIKNIESIKFNKLIVPRDYIVYEFLQEKSKKPIKEFLKHNIYEVNVKNVV